VAGLGRGAISAMPQRGGYATQFLRSEPHNRRGVIFLGCHGSRQPVRNVVAVGRAKIRKIWLTAKRQQTWDRECCGIVQASKITYRKEKARKKYALLFRERHEYAFVAGNVSHARRQE